MRWLIACTIALLTLSVNVSAQTPQTVFEQRIPEFALQSPGDQRELTCLALNVYHEARGSSSADQFSTVLVVLNILKARPQLISVCRVVYDQIYPRGKWVGRFSWTSDGLPDMPQDLEAWLTSQRIAFTVYNDPEFPDITDGATHYHEHSIKPYWAVDGINPVRIGAHIYMTLPQYTRPLYTSR